MLGWVLRWQCFHFYLLPFANQYVWGGGSACAHVCCLWACDLSLAGLTLFPVDVWTHAVAKQILYLVSPCQYFRHKNEFSVTLSGRKNGQIPGLAHPLVATRLWVKGIWKWAKNRQTPAHFSSGKRKKDRELYQCDVLRRLKSKIKSNFQRRDSH